MTDKLLSEIYYDESRPGSLGGSKSLYNEARKQDPLIKLKEVKEWLQGQLVYTLHKDARRKFKRNSVIAEKINENFQADLVDMKEFSNSNDGFSYILTVIDVFSKKAWAIPIKYKSGVSVTNAMEKVLSSNTPFKIQTDNGTEFKNPSFKKLMKKYQIIHFTTKNNDVKCAVVERFNRTLKNKMFRYFTKIGKRRFIDKLEDFLESYNNTTHKATNHTPNNVNKSNEGVVFKNLYGVHTKRELLRKFKKAKLNVGDKVRTQYKLGSFDRGYYPNWSDKVFTIDKKIKNLNKPLYVIKDSTGKVANKRYYPEEIQKIKDNNIYRVEKILKERISKGKKYYFVKWLNHTESENSWVPARDIINIQDGV